MIHNINSASGKSNAEIAKDNKERYMDEIQPSWEKQKWYYKMSRKRAMGAAFILGYLGALLTGLLYLMIGLFI